MMEASLKLLRRCLQNSEDESDKTSGDSGNVYELVIWMFASFLLLVVVIMWTCYWWIGYRLRRVQGGTKARATIDSGTDDHLDEDSIGSRPKVVVVKQRSLPSSEASPNETLEAVPRNANYDQDGMTTQTPATRNSRMSLGSIGSYFREMRWAAWKLGISKERKPPTARRMQKDPPGARKFELSTGVPEGLDESCSDSYVDRRDEYGVGSFASQSHGEDSLYTTP